MKLVKKALLGILLLGVPTLTIAQNVSDTTSKGTTNKISKPKPYKEVITSQAITQNGLFKVHKIDNRYYFEIPDSLLGWDILTVNRISKAAAGLRPANGFYGYSGDEIGENVIRFSLGPNNKVFIQQVSYLDHSSDSSENGMYRSVLNSNFQPIVAAFDIKAFSSDSSAVVIDVTDYLNTDNAVLFFDPQVKKTFGLGTYQADKSYTSKLRSFPQNIEISTVRTYSAPSGETSSFELNSSIVLLPKIPMKPRYFDPRIGYFATGYRDFDVNPQGVEKTNMAIRWRLEPKDEDLEKYKKGELVEPKKPIVFYIDPTTPKKWIPYLIQGVNDWQKAFEQAGFKNAIYALEVPASDSTFSLEDARHNAIIYKPSSIPNAYGPNIHDPRSGEILEAHVGWFHNVMELVHDWYMVQAGAIDPRARKMEFDDSLMGRLIRVVSSHEIGHTLGLAHNFGSSSTVPVDSLRNKKWLEENGHTPSIMDYARFNYIAQPEDSISEAGIFPRIGVYDKWAIEWGYKCLPDFKTREEENAYMNKWVISRVEKNKKLWFSPQLNYEFESRAQSEDLGDNAMKAGYYGMKNLERVASGLKKWTKEPNKDFSALQKMFNQVANQYVLYIVHASKNIGYYNYDAKTVEQDGRLFGFIPKEKQKEAVSFLKVYLFNAPQWLVDTSIFSLLGGNTFFFPGSLQTYVLRNLLNVPTFANLSRFELVNPLNSYSFNELMNDLESDIWKELATKKKIDFYRQVLQKVYVEELINRLKSCLTNVDNATINIYSVKTNYMALLMDHMRRLEVKITKALLVYGDYNSRIHLMVMRERLREAMDPNSTLSSVSGNPNSNGFQSIPSENINMPFLLSPLEGNRKNRLQGCWEDYTLDFLKHFFNR